MFTYSCISWLLHLLNKCMLWTPLTVCLPKLWTLKQSDSIVLWCMLYWALWEVWVNWKSRLRNEEKTLYCLKEEHKVTSCSVHCGSCLEWSDLSTHELLSACMTTSVSLPIQHHTQVFSFICSKTQTWHKEGAHSNTHIHTYVNIYYAAD